HSRPATGPPRPRARWARRRRVWPGSAMRSPGGRAPEGPRAPVPAGSTAKAAGRTRPIRLPSYLRSRPAQSRDARKARQERRARSAPPPRTTRGRSTRGPFCRSRARRRSPAPGRRRWRSGAPIAPARRCQVLPEDERLAVERHLREFDRLGDDLKVIERDLARSALGDEGVKRPMTIPGVDMVVALAIVAAIGDVGRFEQSQKLVSYLGLNPSVRQSGPGPA